MRLGEYPERDTEAVEESPLVFLLSSHYRRTLNLKKYPNDFGFNSLMRAFVAVYLSTNTRKQQTGRQQKHPSCVGGEMGFWNTSVATRQTPTTD